MTISESPIFGFSSSIAMARLTMLLLLTVVTLICPNEALITRETDTTTTTTTSTSIVTSTVSFVSTVTATTVLTTSLFCASFFPSNPASNCRRKRQYLPYDVEPVGFFRQRYPFRHQYNVEHVYNQFEEDDDELIPSPVFKMAASELPNGVILFRDLNRPSGIFNYPTKNFIQPSFDRFSDNYHADLPYHHQKNPERFLWNRINQLSSSWSSLFSYIIFSTRATSTSSLTQYTTLTSTVISTFNSTTTSTSLSYTDTSTYFIVGTCIPAGVSVCSP